MQTVKIITKKLALVGSYVQGHDLLILVPSEPLGEESRELNNLFRFILENIKFL